MPAPDFQDAAFDDFEAVFVSELLDGCLSVAVHLKSHTSSLTRTTKPDTSPHDCSVSNQTGYESLKSQSHMSVCRSSTIESIFVI